MGVVTGREADVLQLSGGIRISPYTLTCAVERVSGMRQYQVSQVEQSKLVVRAVLEDSADTETAVRDIAHAVQKAVPCNVAVTAEVVDRIPPETNRKFRAVVPLGGQSL
jgi:phenylacetate-coenzyme A ligase PaaK-like adenylate-forming protein